MSLYSLGASRASTSTIITTAIVRLAGRLISIAIDVWLFRLFYNHGGWPWAAAFAFASLSASINLARKDS